jgi:hypothetical protein
VDVEKQSTIGSFTPVSGSNSPLNGATKGLETAQDGARNEAEDSEPTQEL